MEKGAGSRQVLNSIIKAPETYAMWGLDVACAAGILGPTGKNNQEEED